MATESLPVEGLTPNENYTIMVFATYTDPSGKLHTSPYSPALAISTPAVSASGGNFQTKNYGTDISLSGGSLFAGDFPADIGQVDLINGSVSGTGVVLNSTGLAGFANGTKQFYIDSATGKAYFAGTVTAGTVQIGPNVNNTGKDGIYINAYNYWYSDGSWSAKGSDIAGALVGSQILKPGAVSSLASNWNSSTNLTISWTFDTTAISAGNYSNQNTQTFILSLTAGGNTKTVLVKANTSSPSQSYVLTPTLNKSIFGVPQTVFTSISVVAQDTFGNLGLAASPITGATYVSPLAIPTSLSVTPINNGYNVTANPSTIFSDPNFQSMQISESTISATSWNSTNFNVVNQGTVNPVSVLTSDLNTRWVSASFVDVLGGTNGWSSVYSVTPNSPVTINTNAPNEVNSVSGSFSNSGSGNDVNISLTVYNISGITATNTSGNSMVYSSGSTPHGFASGDQIKITGMSISGYNATGLITVISSTSFSMSGTTTGSATGGTAQYSGISYIAKLISGSSSGYFYLNLDGTGNTSQSFTISSANIYSQLGAYYSTLSGTLISVNSSGIRSGGKSIASFSRNSTITSITPSPSISASVNGFVVSSDFSNTTAAYLEVYGQYYTWTTSELSSNFPDYMTATYSSGGAAGTNTVTLTNFLNEDGLTISPSLYLGYTITGSNIPANTFVSAVSGSGPTYTLTLSTYSSGSIVASNFSGSGATGTYKINALLYSGSNPANIYSTFYAPTYLVVVYYDLFGNRSLPSTTGSSLFTPINPTTSLINSAVQVGGTAGAIYVGASASTGARILLGVDSYYNTGNNSYSGIFAYDGSATTNAAPTTSIISNAGSGGYTFSTTNAKIADWSINSTQIQNTLGSASNYVGLSATGKYSFWAGATTSGNSSDNASFSVTPTGNVLAKNISIVGSGTITGVNATATGGVMTYTTTSAHGLVVGQLISITGMTSGYNITNKAIESVPTPTTFTVTGTGIGSVSNGVITPILISSGNTFTVDGTGALTATNAIISGTVTASSGSINGNLSLGGSLYSSNLKVKNIYAVTPNGSSGAVYTAYSHTFVAGDVVAISGILPIQYSGIFTISSVTTDTFTIATNTNTASISSVSTSAQAVATGVQSFILNNSGLIFNSPSTKGITTIDGTTGLFVTNAAYIGGWSVNSAGISKTTGHGTLKLDQSNVYISASSSTYSSGIATPNLDSSSDVVFWAGSSGARSTSNNFYVTADGTLHASSAVISGSITANSVNIDSNNQWYSNNFKVGNGSTQKLSWDGSTLNLTGDISATSGTIGGFTLTSWGLQNSADTVEIYATNSGPQGAVYSIWTSKSILAKAFQTVTGASNDLTIAGGATFGNSNFIINTSGQVSSSLSVTGSTYLIGTAGASTTTSSPNLFINSSSGYIARYSSSSERYKENIVDIKTISGLNPSALLKIPVRSFTYKKDYLDNDDARLSKSVPGFIAEEMQAIYPIAVDTLNGQPETWNPKYIIPGMLSLIQDHEKTIQELSNKIDILKSKFDSLNN